MPFIQVITNHHPAGHMLLAISKQGISKLFAFANLIGEKMVLICLFLTMSELSNYSHISEPIVSLFSELPVFLLGVWSFSSSSPTTKMRLLSVIESHTEGIALVTV